VLQSHLGLIDGGLARRRQMRVPRCCLAMKQLPAMSIVMPAAPLAALVLAA